MLKVASAMTYEFQRGKVDEDGSCLYTSFRYVNGSMNGIDNRKLRSLVADYIREHPQLHLAALKNGTKYKTVKEYCNQIQKHNLLGGEPEIRALAMRGHILIRMVCMTTTDDGDININMLNYGEDMDSFEECVYILYDERKKHYDPLFVVNKQDSTDKRTIFKRDDQMIIDLADKFIAEQRRGSESDPSYEMEVTTKTKSMDEHDNIFDRIIPAASTSLSHKRQLPAYDHDNLSLARTTEIYETPVKKCAKYDNLETWTYYEDTPEKLLQTNMFEIEYSSLMEQQPTTDVSITASENIRMRFEVDPAEGFRGRTSSEFKPKKTTKRDGTPSEARPPRYFTDGNTRQYLNLLIPVTYLSADSHQNYLEICIVTRDINGYTYIHPYFKFQVHRTDRNVPDANPIYLFLDGDVELKPYVDELFQQIKLKQVVVMHKNNELMQAEQPLPIFSVTNNNANEAPITTKYGTHNLFKNAYHLHDIRFAITLCNKTIGNDGEEIYIRHEDKQFISTISTEDKNYKQNSGEE